MLVLSRQRDESILIGDHIELTVVDIRGDKVRLGINAPAQIAVHRKEVHDAIRRENEQAAHVSHGQLATVRPEGRSEYRAPSVIPTAAHLSNGWPNGRSNVQPNARPHAGPTSQPNGWEKKQPA